VQINLQAGHGPQNRPNAYMDNARIREEVGYRPEYTIDQAIAEYIDWLRKHPE
jgi:UDP-glucose 4-epimerase